MVNRTFDALLWAIWLECQYQNHVVLCGRASAGYPASFPILPDDRAAFGANVFR